MATPVLGQPIQRFRCFDFSGGLDVMTPPTKLALFGEKNKWLTVASNVVYTGDGSVSKRWGMIQKGDGTVFAAEAITGGIEWAPSTPPASQTDVIASNAGIVRKVTSGGYTSIKTGLTSTRNYSFAIYNDLLHVANAVDAPQKWDGTTWAALGGSSPSKASLFVPHGNRLFALDPQVPSRAYWSKLNNTLDWSGTTDAGFMDVNPNDGGVLVTLVPSIQELILGKTQRPYRLQGIGPATGYTVADNLTPAAGSIGPTSLQAAAFIGNDVWYGSQTGIHRLSATQAFGDLQNTFVSRRIEPYFRAGTLYAPDASVAYAGFSGFVASPKMVYDQENNLVLYATKRGTGTVACDTILAYNLELGAWSDWHYDGGLGFTTQGELSSLWSSHSGAHQSEIRFGMSSAVSGATTLAAFRRDRTSDFNIASGAMATVAIAAQIRHVSHLDAPGVEKVPRYLYLYFAKEASTTTMTLNLYADFKTAAVFTATFDITSTTAETQVVKRIDLGGFTCEYLEVDLQQATADKKFTFYGYEVHYRERRRVRRAE